jgi:DNA helicase II / ATP-dependent DNA helicase PcrA
MPYYKGRYGSGMAHDGSSYNKRKWNPSWKKGPTIERGSTYKPIANPTSQQLAIFRHVESVPRSLIVKALAGCSKTTSAVESMQYIQEGKSVLYVIFANRNAREAEGKCAEHITVKTLHAFGMAQLRKAFGKSIEVDDKGEKSRAIATALFGPDDEKIEVRYNFCRALDLARGYLADDVEAIVQMLDKHGLDTGDHSAVEFAGKVLEGLKLCVKQYQRVEFSDMVYLPIAMNLNIEKFDYVYLDESQDASPSKIELVLRALKPDSKLISIGDEHQAIFAFTGADAHAMKTIQEKTGADSLPLTQTFRCGKAIVELARGYVPEYEAAESNPEGEVLDKTSADMMKPFDEGGAGPGDFILSRVNACLVSICLSFIRSGRKATVMGKDLGKELTYTIKRSGATDVVSFMNWLDNWKNVECEKLIARNKPTERITDKYDTLVALTDGTNDLDVVKQRITDMFSDDNVENVITCSTAHKSKGMERKRVWLLSDTFARMRPTTPLDIEQESNLLYVSITRAINTLIRVKN